MPEGRDLATIVVAIIPARGGSKGLARKNLRMVGGCTLVEHAVREAMSAQLVTTVVGTTDDDDIADEFLRLGSHVVRRPDALGADDVPDAPVFLHALDSLAALGISEPDVVVNLRPTAPLRTAAHIDGAISVLLGRPDVESVKSVSVVSEHPYKMWTEADGLLQPLLPKWHDEYGGDPDIARQLLTRVLRSNGMIDLVRTKSLRRTGRFHSGRIAAFEVDAASAIDIDDEIDLERAEARYQEVRGR